jgi:coenzyme F420-dependent glucose-6-phosphate dehydrogenase
MDEGARTAGRDPAGIVKMIEIKVSYDHDREYARDACDYWAPLALTPEQKRDVEDPVELERLAYENPGIAQRRFIVSDDADEVVERIGGYVALGFDHLVFHAPGDDQLRFLDQFCRDVVPKLRERW